jgi:dTMP kinase
VTGTFIVVEGVEGAGKSTQVALLAAWLEELAVASTITREPGGTALGEAVRALVLERTDLHVPRESELLLILAARAVFVRDVVRPALERGEVVVADRYELSTLAYQGYGRELNLDTVRKLNAFASVGLTPDLVLVLDVPVEVGLGRQRREGKVADRMERETGDFLGRVREGYLTLAREESNTVLIEAGGTPDEVFVRVRAALSGRFPGAFPTGSD